MKFYDFETDGGNHYLISGKNIIEASENAAIKLKHDIIKSIVLTHFSAVIINEGGVGDSRP